MLANGLRIIKGYEHDQTSRSVVFLLALGSDTAAMAKKG